MAGLATTRVVAPQRGPDALLPVSGRGKQRSRLPVRRAIPPARNADICKLLPVHHQGVCVLLFAVAGFLTWCSPTRSARVSQGRLWIASLRMDFASMLSRCGTLSAAESADHSSYCSRLPSATTLRTSFLKSTRALSLNSAAWCRRLSLVPVLFWRFAGRCLGAAPTVHCGSRRSAGMATCTRAFASLRGQQVGLSLYLTFCSCSRLAYVFFFCVLVRPDPAIAQRLRPHTLRARFGADKVHNAVHCTDLPEDVEIEVRPAQSCFVAFWLTTNLLSLQMDFFFGGQ